MLYLTSAILPQEREAMTAAGIGLMLTPLSGVRLLTARHYRWWGADNGCYARGAAFDLDAYLRWLSAMSPVTDTCLFATAPDVVGDAAATWERSRDVLPQIRALGYPAALVAQDGWDSTVTDWDAFDALFIGGTTGWKCSEFTHRLVGEAKRRGKWVHVGRVNGWPRFSAFALSGADSADGTNMAFNPTRYLPELIRWGHRLRMQRTLWEVNG